jgi:hypothetical protein
MLEGAQVSLYMGEGFPRPVPAAVAEALLEAQVTSADGQRSGFQLTFATSGSSPLTRELLRSGFFDPPTRVVILLTVNGTPTVMMDGVITRHDLNPGDAPGSGRLTVTGVDISQLMDLIDLSGVPYPAMPGFARAELILIKYALLGVIPLVIPSVLVDVPIPTERYPSQQGTDYAYVTQLAQEVGYVFYVDPGPAVGVSTAYWGPAIRTGPLQPALTVGMDQATNVESLSFAFDGISKSLYILLVQEKNTRIPIPVPIPDVTPLSPPLGSRPPIPLSYKPVNRGEDNSIDSTAGRRGLLGSALRGLARAAESANVITASGSLDVRRYGHVLKARQLVGVRGAGYAYDGSYYVKSVTTSMKPGECKQRFQLTRNAHDPLSSEVPA